MAERNNYGRMGLWPKRLADVKARIHNDNAQAIEDALVALEAVVAVTATIVVAAEGGNEIKVTITTNKSQAIFLPIYLVDAIGVIAEEAFDTMVVSEGAILLGDLDADGGGRTRYWNVQTISDGTIVLTFGESGALGPLHLVVALPDGTIVTSDAITFVT